MYIDIMGKNTFPQEHHQWIADLRAVEPPFVQQRMAPLLGALSYYPLPEPYGFLPGKKKGCLFLRNNPINTWQV